MCACMCAYMLASREQKHGNQPANLQQETLEPKDGLESCRRRPARNLGQMPPESTRQLQHQRIWGAPKLC